MGGLLRLPGAWHMTRPMTNTTSKRVHPRSGKYTCAACCFELQRCTACRVARAAHQRLRHASKVAAGECTDCSAKAKCARKRCQRCLDKRALLTAAKRLRTGKR